MPVTVNEVANIKLFHMANIRLNCYIPCILSCLAYINENLIGSFLWKFSFNYKYMIKKGKNCKEGIIGVDIQSFEKESEEFLQLFCIKTIRTRITEHFIDKIKCCVDENIPIIMTLDQYYDINSTLYLKERNSFHYIVIIGYNDIDNTITYYDYRITGAPEKRTIDYISLEKGVESYLTADHSATNFKYYISDASDNIFKQEFLYSSENCRRVVSKMIKFYSYESENYRCLQDYTSLLEKQIKYNSCSTEYFEDLFNTFSLDIIAFKGIDEFIIKSIENDVLPELYQQYNIISQKYKAIYNTILKAKYSSNIRDFVKVQELFQKILQLERGLYKTYILTMQGNENTLHLV